MVSAFEWLTNAIWMLRDIMHSASWGEGPSIIMQMVLEADGLYLLPTYLPIYVAIYFFEKNVYDTYQ